jgi:hypothetical protein
MKNDQIPPNPYPVKPPPNLPKPRKETMQAEIERLKAENERLRKAGDELAYALANGDRMEYGSVDDPIEEYLARRNEVQAWNAAKDGKPTK